MSTISLPCCPLTILPLESQSPLQHSLLDVTHPRLVMTLIVESVSLSSPSMEGHYDQVGEKEICPSATVNSQHLRHHHTCSSHLNLCPNTTLATPLPELCKKLTRQNCFSSAFPLLSVMSKDSPPGLLVNSSTPLLALLR